MLSVLRAAFRYAFEEYLIQDNPFLWINISKYSNLLMTPTPISHRVHSDDEIQKMIDYIHDYQSGHPSYVPAYALELQMLMGLRRWEVAPLEWSDIHDDMYITISKERITVKKSETNDKYRYVIVQHTKTFVDRQFPITEEIRSFLMRYKEVHDNYYIGKTQCFFPRLQKMV